MQVTGAVRPARWTGGAEVAPAGTVSTVVRSGPQSTRITMTPCWAAASPLMVLATVRVAGAGSYWSVTTAVPDPPAGIVTVSGKVGVVVTSIAGLLPSSGSVMTHVVPTGNPVMVNGSVVVAFAGMEKVVGRPAQVATSSIGPCWPPIVPVMVLATVSDPSTAV